MNSTGGLSGARRPSGSRRDWPALMMRVAYATYVVLAVFVLLTIAVSLAGRRVPAVPRAALAVLLSAAGVGLWTVYRRRTP
jgi:hypothetical protein